MNFVVAAYGLTVLFIGGYALSIVLRRREERRALDAWNGPEAAVSDGGWQTDDDSGSGGPDTGSGGLDTDSGGDVSGAGSGETDTGGPEPDSSGTAP